MKLPGQMRERGAPSRSIRPSGSVASLWTPARRRKLALPDHRTVRDGSDAETLRTHASLHHLTPRYVTPAVLGQPGSQRQRHMKRLVDASLAIDGTLDHIDQAKLAATRHEYPPGAPDRRTEDRRPRWAAHAASTTPWPGACSSTKTTTCGTPVIPGCPSTSTPQNERSGWESCGSRSPGACAPWPAPKHSAPAAPTCPPPPARHRHAGRTHPRRIRIGLDSQHAVTVSATTYPVTR